MKINDYIPNWPGLRSFLEHAANVKNKSLFKDIFGQTAYEMLPLTARWLIGLIPEKDFREKIMPLMRIGNLALPALAVAIRQVTKLSPEWDGYISAIAAQLRTAINNRGRSSKEPEKDQIGKPNSAMAASDSIGANPSRLSLGIILLFISAELQSKFFANFNKISDPEVRRLLLEMEFTLTPAEAAAVKNSQEISPEFLGATIKKVEGLAQMSEADFLVWVDNMVNKPEAKKSFFSLGQTALKTGWEKAKQNFKDVKQKQTETIAALREKNNRRAATVKSGASSPVNKVINWLNGL